jgi:hypothetical protein
LNIGIPVLVVFVRQDKIKYFSSTHNALLTMETDNSRQEAITPLSKYLLLLKSDDHHEDRSPVPYGAAPWCPDDGAGAVPAEST